MHKQVTWFLLWYMHTTFQCQATLRSFLPSHTGRPVAFTAKLKIDECRQKQDGVLTFADVSLNQGEGYNADTGVFTCPAAGLYHFIVSVTVYGRVQCAILKNGEKVLSLYHANKPDALSYNSSHVASISGLVRLVQRDRVWVNLCGQGRHDIFATEDNDTIFTGFCLGWSSEKVQ